MKNFFLLSGAILMALAVMFGAFGAHVVESLLTPDRFDVYQTAVDYHFYHALGLLIIGLIYHHHPGSVWVKRAGWSIFTGVMIFSGSLYLLTLTDTGWLGAITPVGGAFMIGGWICLVVGIIKSEKEKLT